MLTDIATSLPALFTQAQSQAFSWAGWIMAAGAGSALLSDFAMSTFRQRDKRIGYLAEFLDIPEDDILPLPPATALWALYAQRNGKADPEAELPPGAVTLQGSYLVMGEKGTGLVCIHNLEDTRLIADPDIPDMAAAVDARPNVGAGLIDPEAFPLLLEEDAVKRTDLVDYLLKARFRYGGMIQPFVLLKDGKGLAGPAEVEYTRQDQPVERLHFADPTYARAAISGLNGGSLPERQNIQNWLSRWAGRTTTMSRRLWRTWLVALGIGVGMSGGADNLLDMIFRS